MGGTRRRAAVPLVALAVVAAACSADVDAGGGATAPTTADPTTTSVDAPVDPEPASAPWERVDAPSTCRCSDGSPYHFFVKRADPERVVFYLEGGGACFSADTCGPTNPTYTRNLDDGGTPAGAGIFADDERNPFAGWSMVYVPYCTGDLHLGDQVQDYGDGVVVDHNGAVNASAALTAMAATFPDASHVAVAGSSAGSASAPLYGGLAHDVLPDAEITVVADASAGYPRDEVITSAIGALWGAFENLPEWPTSAGEPATAWSLPGLFVRTGRHVPDLDVATLNHAYDDVQARFSALIGNTGDLRERIVENDEWIESHDVEVHSWVAPGTEHTILERPELYTSEVDGVVLHEWLAGVVGDDDVPDVRCTDCR